MKIAEVINTYTLSMEKLQAFEEAGFFKDMEIKDGEREWKDADIAFICKLLTFTRLEMSNEQITEYLKEEKQGNMGKVCMLLKQQREKLLDVLHQKQKDIDCLDYLIYEVEHAKK